MEGKEKTTQQELFLWQRYYFNRDMGDVNRANYWAKRIEEFNKEKELKSESTH